MGKEQSQTHKKKRVSFEEKTIKEGEEFIIISKRITKPTKPNKTFLHTKPKVKRVKKKKNIAHESESERQSSHHKNDDQKGQKVLKKNKGDLKKKKKIVKKKKNMKKKVGQKKFGRKEARKEGRKRAGRGQAIPVNLLGGQGMPMPTFMLPRQPVGSFLNPPLLFNPLPISPLQKNPFNFLRIQIQICFCIDRSGSMFDHVRQFQKIIPQLEQHLLQRFSEHSLFINLGLVAYTDHEKEKPEKITTVERFGTRKNSEVGCSLLPWGGGDSKAEGVHDGLMDAAVEASWSIASTHKYIFHIYDSPPHGKQFLNDEQQEGCTCGLKTSQVCSQINKRNLKYRGIRISNSESLAKMSQIFKQNILDYQEFQVDNLNQLENIIIEEIRGDIEK